MKITIIRHGKTEYNSLNKLHGRSNIPLNDTGRRDCKKLKYKIKNEQFDICFSSPLIRTVETAMILVGDRVEIKIDDRLVERELGDLEGEDSVNYDNLKYWDYNLNSSDYGVEPVKDLINRTRNFLSYLRENYKDKNILIITHSAVIRALHHILHNTDLNSNLCDFNIENCYIETIEL